MRCGCWLPVANDSMALPSPKSYVGIAGKTAAPARMARLRLDHVSLYYGNQQVLNDITLDVFDSCVTAIIGPTGSGKSSLLRCMNRTNEHIHGAVVEGDIWLSDQDVNGPDMDPTRLRTRVSMVHQDSALFPASVFDNVAYGPRISGIRNRRELRELVQDSLAMVGLWQELHNQLAASAIGLSASQQHRLCIARSLANSPDVVLLDEPTHDLDPAAATKTEDLIFELKSRCPVIVATNDLQFASRVSDRTAFLMQGELIEEGETTELFTMPRDSRTEDYVTGRFG